MTASETDNDRQPLERVTVNFIPRAAAALTNGMRITGDSKTDFINRAVQALAFLEEQASQGGHLLIREPGSNELLRIVFA